mmetsp:Transcript_36598/g.50334  ORF Transcript_36598/g.50334 Transcript_36598/m.50334 type:complete len:380 (-) Transcript_36598:110-1249(-)
MVSEGGVTKWSELSFSPIARLHICAKSASSNPKNIKSKKQFVEMTEELCGAKLYVPGPHFEAKLAVVQKNNSQKLLSKENFEENGISLSFERDKCLQIQTTNGGGAEPVILEFWSSGKKTDFQTYETANMRIERGSVFGHSVGSDSRLFVFDLVNSKKSKERRPDIASVSSVSPLHLDFHHDHTCYRFLVFLQEKSAAKKLMEKEQKLREEESELLRRLTKLKDELELLRHQSQSQQKEVPVSYPARETMMQVDSDAFNLSGVNPPVQVVTDESPQQQHNLCPPPSKRRKIEKQTPTEAEEEAEWPMGFDLSDPSETPFSPSIFPDFSFPLLSDSSSFNPPAFLETPGSSYFSDSLFTPNCDPLFDSAESFFPPPTPHF